MVDFLPALAVCGHLVLVGLLMVSNIPTWSFKVVTTSPKNSKYFLIGFAVIGAAFLNYIWFTLIALCIGYILLVLFTVITGKAKRPIKI
jgi:CDP-diacylglycerol--serine O-phosphatidyltransferase